MQKLRATPRKTTKKAPKAAFETLPVLIEQDEDGMYIGTVPSLRSCYTQGATLAELYENLQEAVDLSREVEKDYFGTKRRTSRIVGFQNIDFRA